MGACASMLGLGFSKNDAPALIEAPFPSSSNEPLSVPSHGGVVGASEVQNEALLLADETDMNQSENNDGTEGNNVTLFPELQNDDPKRRSLGILLQESDSPKNDGENKVEAVSVKENHSSVTVKNMAEFLSIKDIRPSAPATNMVKVNQVDCVEEEKHSSEVENKLVEVTSIEEEEHSSEVENKLAKIKSVEEEKHSSEVENKLVEIKSVEEERHSSEVENKLVEVTSIEVEKHSSKVENKLVEFTSVEEEKHSSEAENKLVEITSVEEEKHSSETEKNVTEVAVEGDCTEVEVKNPESTILILEGKIDESVEKKAAADLADIMISENGIQKKEPHENYNGEVSKAVVFEDEEDIHIGVMEVEASEKPNADKEVSEVFEVSEKSIQAKKPSNELQNQSSVETESKSRNSSEESKSVIMQSLGLEANPAKKDVE